MQGCNNKPDDMQKPTAYTRRAGWRVFFPQQSRCHSKSCAAAQVLESENTIGTVRSQRETRDVAY